MQVDISILTKQETVERLTLHKGQHWLSTGLRLSLTVIMALFVLFKTTQVQAQAVEVGAISDVKGAARVLRDTPYTASLNFNLLLRDDLRTSQGRLEATFLDDSTVRLWTVPDLTRKGLLKRTGARTNYRVCKDSLEVVAVLPFPKPETVWAPKELCKKDPSQ